MSNSVVSYLLKSFFSILICILLLPCSQPMPAVQATPLIEIARSGEVPPDRNTSAEFGELFAGWSGKEKAINAGGVSEGDPGNSESGPGNSVAEKIVYLTFDDGPDPDWTPLVLDILLRHNARATFYVVGRSVKTYPEVILQLAQAGQMIANHSYNHVSLSKLSWQEFYYELKNTENAVREILAPYVDLEQQIGLCIRPPYGDVNGNVWTYAYRLQYDVSMWSLDTLDWKGLKAEEIVETVMDKVKPGAIILMHDGGTDRTETVKALSLILHELTIQGYHFPALCTATGQVSQ
ncbi:MAG: polysaccharide deacetylase family protein [Chloroflexota bacterium]